MFKILFRSPPLTSLVLQIWKRNFLNFKKTIVVSLFWILFEPVIYLGALGFGLGTFVTQIEGKSFVQFLFPGILCFTAMIVSFFEATYGTYHKLSYQKTFQTMLMTPLSPYDIVFGEILWSASKGFFGVCGVILVGSIMGLVESWRIFAVLPVLFMICWMFAALGMVVTSWARNYDSFIYSTSGFITPMTMVAGVYFPTDQLPFVMQYASYILPLTQAVELVRTVLDGNESYNVLVYIGGILIIGYCAQNYAMKRIRRRLVS